MTDTILPLDMRPLGPDDGPAIVRLMSALSFADQFQRFGRLFAPAGAQRYAAKALQRRGFIIGVFEGGQLVAMGEATPRRPVPDSVIDGAMVVAPGRQGRGLGAAVVGAMIKHAAEDSHATLCLTYPADCERMTRIVLSVIRETKAGRDSAKSVTLSEGMQGIDGLEMTTAAIPLNHNHIAPERLAG